MEKAMKCNLLTTQEFSFRFRLHPDRYQLFTKPSCFLRQQSRRLSYCFISQTRHEF